MIHQVSVNFIRKKEARSVSKPIEYNNSDTQLASIIRDLNQCPENYCVVIQVIDTSSLKNHQKKIKQFQSLVDGLSKRELEILELALKGLSIKQIAKKLFISNETVRTHRKNIVNKAGVSRLNDIKNWLFITNFDLT